MSNRPRRPSPRSRRDGGFTATAQVALSLLLIAPTLALSRLTSSIDWRVLIAVPVTVSVVAYLLYRSDKRKATAGDWRIPESTLHLADLCGGWPGAFVAQRIFRHKTAKTSFQVKFWLIVVAHQYVAVESLMGWQLTRRVVRAVTGPAS